MRTEWRWKWAESRHFGREQRCAGGGCGIWVEDADGRCSFDERITVALKGSGEAPGCCKDLSSAAVSTFSLKSTALAARCMESDFSFKCSCCSVGPNRVCNHAAGSTTIFSTSTTTTAVHQHQLQRMKRPEFTMAESLLAHSSMMRQAAERILQLLIIPQSTEKAASAEAGWGNGR